MKVISRKNYKVGIKVVAVALVFSLAMWASYVHGEQVGGAPESGSTSYIKSLYTALQTSGFGSDTASPDWGTYWNRLKTSAQWAPSGTATAANVVSGKTFYGSDRTQQTGTQPTPGVCPTQPYHDSYGAPVTQTTNCTNTLTWTVPSGSITGTEKQDPRSGLIWSNAIVNTAGTATFSPTTNTAFSWDASAAANIAVGNKTAITLCSTMGNGWRLPAQKELMQAYIDGSDFNLSQPGNSFWSATESSSTFAWGVLLYSGTTNFSTKTSTAQVRCVR
jgi:hypothetical protein